jgi:four helix bundle protein
VSYPIADALQARAAAFAVHLLKYVRSCGTDAMRDPILRQLLRSGTSVGANYRAARRARSRLEFIAKLGLVVEEADETEHGRAMMRDASLSSGPDFEWLLGEAKELRAIFSASLHTGRAHHLAAKSSDR